MLQIGNIVKINNKGREKLGLSKFYADQIYKITIIYTRLYNRKKYLLKSPHVKSGIYLYEGEESFVDIVDSSETKKVNTQFPPNEYIDYLNYSSSFKKSYYSQYPETWFYYESKNMDIPKNNIEKRGHPLTKIFK